MISSRSCVVVSKFATFRYRSPSELRNQNDTRNQYVASVLSIPKFVERRYRDVANFGIGTLGERCVAEFPVPRRNHPQVRLRSLRRGGLCPCERSSPSLRALRLQP